jgi:hypothetical protein
MENNIEHESTLTGEESLQLITSMINKAKNEFLDTGLSSLLWGSVITFCALVTFANYWLKWPALDYVWFLSIAAVAPQVFIGIREGKERRYKSHEGDLIGGIWIAFAIAIFIYSYVANAYRFSQATSVYLILYSIPTVAIGIGRRFRPMIVGGIACWILAILCTFTPFPYEMLCLAAGAQLAWFIPGLILRKCYLQAKRKHV